VADCRVPAALLLVREVRRAILGASEGFGGNVFSSRLQGRAVCTSRSLVESVKAL
jgi:hypothetical protein